MDRQIAISDIHGCARTFEKLLFDVVALQPTDTLFLLGDYINKGPDSKGVIDQIFSLEKKGFDVYCLRGNHEQILIDGLEDPEMEIDFLARGGVETLQSFSAATIADIPELYLEFILNLGFYIELQDYLLVHAGFNFADVDLYQNEYAMLNTRVMDINPERIGGRKIIHGHVPTPLTSIQESIHSDGHHISIDAGCVYQHIHVLNHLVALDIGGRKLYIQKNID